MMKFAMLAFAAVVVAGCDNKQDVPVTIDSPVAPGDAISTFALEPGFRIELIASEPLIADPVAMEIDENGALYVVENHGYPLDSSRSSKVKLLRDVDGDGRMDKSTVFADTLMMPTGVMRWKKGILVTDAPHVLYMEDTNGDDRADIIKPLLTGFALSNPQHNVNTPIYGLDNWIYIAHERGIGSEVFQFFNDRGTEVHYPERKDGVRLAQNANGRNVRMRPDTWELEMLASTTQYGHSFDEWGNHFLVNNSNHAMHSVVAAEYLNRNPRLIVARSTNYLPDHGNAAEVFPITRTPDRQLLTDVGVMTSACALTVYTGGAFGTEFNEGHTFVAEPVSSIVHMDKLNPKGSTFVASRVHTRKEFLASTDMWSRPVNLYIGPDGALYVVDYYREIIEHPEWLSDDVINSGNLYNGHDMGRIFRVSKEDAGGPDWTRGLNFGNATDEQLLEKISDPNLWWRRTAQRLVIDRDARHLVPRLADKARNDKSAIGRLHALWTLQGLEALKPDLIAEALKDEEAGIRANAVKLAEMHLKRNPELADALIEMKDDSDARVRFQLLCTLGFVDSREAADVRNKLLFQDVQDEFVQVAALSAPSSQTERLLESVLSRYERDNPSYASLVQTLATMVGAGEEKGYAVTLLRLAATPLPEDSITWQAPVLKGLARGFGIKHSPLSSAEQGLLIDAFFDHPARSIRQASLLVLQSRKVLPSAGLQRAVGRARVMASNDTLNERDRALALNFLALQDATNHADLLKSLVLSRDPLPVRLAAVRAMNAIADETIVEFSMANWQSLDPAIQDAALNAFMEKESRVRVLIEALEKGKVHPTTVGWGRSIRLMTQRNVELRNRARAFFENDDERKKVVADYETALSLSGEIGRGKQVYQRSCAICHQVKGEGGIPFGPDLGTIQSWPASGIMANILDPNQSISHGFDLWNIVLKNGESLQGVISAETPSSLTVRNASGQVTVFARDEIESQKALNMSAMPVGLEKDISHQDMADLLAYLRNGN